LIRTFQILIIIFYLIQKIEITEMSNHDNMVDGGDAGQQPVSSNKKRHFIHQGNHVTVIEGENVSSSVNGYHIPTSTTQNINYNSLERGTRRKLPQVPNGIIHPTNGGLMNGNISSDLYTHSLPRKSKAHVASSRYVPRELLAI
jgi:hypothetical protein